MKTLMEIWMNGRFVHHLFLGSVTDSFVVRKGKVYISFVCQKKERGCSASVNEAKNRTKRPNNFATFALGDWLFISLTLAICFK